MPDGHTSIANSVFAYAWSRTKLPAPKAVESSRARKLDVYTLRRMRCCDWPISYADLEPYYNRVDKFLGVAGLGGDPAYPALDYEMPPHPLGRAGMRGAAGMNKLGWHWWPRSQAIPSAKFKEMAKCVRWGVCETGCPAGAKASLRAALDICRQAIEHVELRIMCRRLAGRMPCHALGTIMDRVFSQRGLEIHVRLTCYDGAGHKEVCYAKARYKP